MPAGNSHEQRSPGPWLGSSSELEKDGDTRWHHAGLETECQRDDECACTDDGISLWLFDMSWGVLGDRKRPGQCIHAKLIEALEVISLPVLPYPPHRYALSIQWPTTIFFFMLRLSFAEGPTAAGRPLTFYASEHACRITPSASRMPDCCDLGLQIFDRSQVLCCNK